LLVGYAILARHPDELLPGVSPVEFVATIGICITMKALPVLGAILGEMDLFGTRIGHLALGVAGVIERSFPILGSGFRALAVATVALNEMVGPVLFKVALDRAGETSSAPRPSLSSPAPS